MKESGYYPEGAEFDKDAPWNQVDLPEKEFNIYVSQSLSKDMTVLTNDYKQDFYEDEIPEIDTKNTCWNEVFANSGHYTPIKLIQLFKQFLETKLKVEKSGSKQHLYKHLIDECSNWQENECIIEEN